MKHLLLGLFLTPLTAWAQQIALPDLHSVEHTEHRGCRVYTLPGDKDVSCSHPSISTWGVPSVLPEENTDNLVFDNGYDYVYRLAMCISPEFFNGVFQGDIAQARAWVKQAGEYLNMVYLRDLGIRFDIVDDERLFLKSFPEGFPEEKFIDAYGTTIFNQILGSENYDCGILIRPASMTLDGSSILAGAYANTHKGSSMSTMSFTTIAHELGHMFGSRHTHKISDGWCIEPGSGQSIMGYGSPSTSFSFASVVAIRQRLRHTRYYLSNQRDPNHIGGGDVAKDNENLPYVVPTERTRPELDRSRIRKKYTITRDTRFQFYIPVKEAKSSFTYGAQNYDAAVYGYETNELQPAYDLSSSPNVMFQPYYNEGHNQEGKTDAVMVTGSDAFRPGRYTFLMAVADGARYDMEKVELNIVEGKQFHLKSNLKMDQFFGKPLDLEWEPCTELYGEDSKVRILLSDDFGQTYKYVIDDQVPNTGKWSGFWPYVEVDRVQYRNFSRTLPGGVVKIEVIGEAAYTVSKEIPAYANPNIMYYGGFTLNGNKAYLQFKDGPEQFLTVKDEQSVPAMTDLQAFEKNNPGRTRMVAGTETRDGNVIRRQWKTELNGYPYAYSQIIVIEDAQAEKFQLVEHQAELLSSMATDLHLHQGDLGYPQPSLPIMQQFQTAYDAVFTPEGEVQPDADITKIEALRGILNKLGQVKDNEVVKPASRHYYTLRNFQDIYGREAYYYLAPKLDPYANNAFTRDEARATVWRCTTDGAMYSFNGADGNCINMEPFISPGYQEKLSLDRGYTWGAFTLVNENKACAQLSQKGSYFTRNENYVNDPVGYRTNHNSTVSTDFQFVPVDFIEARKPGAERPWNVLESKQQFTLEDTYSDLFVGKDVSIEQLQYTRQFHDTNWQTLYLPFDTKLSDWSQHCEVACLDEIQMPSQSAGRSTSDAVATYVLVTEGTLKANQPYLIRAKETGTHTFILGKVTVKPTEENKSQLSVAGYDVHMNGNYGTLSAATLQKANGYVLQGNQMKKADEAMGTLPSMRWYVTVSANGGSTALPENILLVEKGEKPIGTLSIETQEGYGTIYTEESYVMPQGVTGYYVTDVDVVAHEMVLSEVYQGGAIVPAATPLLVKGEKRTYMLYAPKEAAATNDEAQTQQNLLMGTATATMTTAPQGQNSDAYYFYALSYGDVNNAGTQPLGFYWASSNGAAFTNGANKAYLAVEKQKAADLSGFATPGNGTTGIETIAPVGEKLEVYTISGMRLYPQSLSQLQPGIYIVNGKKVVVK